MESADASRETSFWRLAEALALVRKLAEGFSRALPELFPGKHVVLFLFFLKLARQRYGLLVAGCCRYGRQRFVHRHFGGCRRVGDHQVLRILLGRFVSDLCAGWGESKHVSQDALRHGPAAA